MRNIDVLIFVLIGLTLGRVGDLIFRIRQINRRLDQMCGIDVERK